MNTYKHAFLEISGNAPLDCCDPKKEQPHPRKGTYYIYCIKGNDGPWVTKNAGMCEASRKFKEESVPEQYIVRTVITVPQR